MSGATTPKLMPASATSTARGGSGSGSAVDWPEFRPRPRLAHVQQQRRAAAATTAISARIPLTQTGTATAAAATLQPSASASALATAAAANPYARRRARRLAHRSAHPTIRSTLPPHAVLWRSSPFPNKHEQIKQLLIRNRTVFPVATAHLAALAIQRLWRGHFTRSRLQQTLHLLWTSPKSKGQKNAAAATGAGAGATSDVKTATPASAGAGAAARPASATAASARRVPTEEEKKRSAAAAQNLYLKFVALNPHTFGATTAATGSGSGGSGDAATGNTHASDEALFHAFEEWCTIKIQRAWRHARIRRHAKYKRFGIYNVAAHSIARTWRARARRAFEVANRTGTRYRSAVRIQRAWKGYTFKRVYKYFRDLIIQRQKSDPVLLLRSLNPREARLMDSASGLYVRFRFSGIVFPPLIVYKIFTAHAVTDINSFAPREYTHAAQKQKTGLTTGGMGTTLHTHHPSATAAQASPTKTATAAKDMTETRAGWYKRWENNGWRPISEKLLLAADEESLAALSRTSTGVGLSSAMAAAKTIDYHHDKLVRQVDLLKKRKQKKLGWLKKMYQTHQTISAAATATATSADTSAGATDVKSAAPPPTGNERLQTLQSLNPALHHLMTAAATSTAAASAAASRGVKPTSEAAAATRAERTLQRLTAVDHTSDDMLDVAWEDEADQLLKWTHGLDFERYQDEWFITATSRPADKYYREIELDELQRTTTG